MCVGLCTHTCVQTCVYMNAGSLRGQKKASDPVELKLYEVEPPGVGAGPPEEQQGFLTKSHFSHSPHHHNLIF